MDFLRRLFGESKGYLGIVVISGDKRSEHLFDYPGELTSIEKKVSGWSKQQGANVYFYPVLFEFPDTNSTVVCSPVIAADLDMVSPVLVTPRPDYAIESSGGRFQAYWYRNGDGDQFNPLSVNGAVVGDRRLKRLPGTRNWKYGTDPWLVREIDPSGLDTYSAVANRKNLSGNSYDQLFHTNDRWSLARLCARLGCTTQETFLALQASQDALNARPGSDDYVPIGTLYKDAVDAVASSGIPSLLTEEEIREVGDGEDNSFVSRYVSWATRRTDSPSQYHIAGALTVLSILLSPHIRLPTEFGEFRPNLWFMILAGTTLTRKTTAMEMAVALAKCVDPDVVLSTNGTGEGIITALAERDGESALFHRDEISGFLRETNEKKYMSGILETLTRLYDGGSERRTLRRQVIEVNDPNFQILCGGIKDKTIELLTSEHIASGFLPRFLMVCGWTRVEDMRPIGPPREDTLEMRSSLVSYLEGLSRRYTPTARPTNNGSQPPGPLKVKASDAAWERMRQLEASIHELGLSSDSPDIFSPLYERYMNSIIKVSVLLAADRAHRENCKPIVEVGDLLRAISYASVWLESMHEVARGIEDKPTKDEIKVIRIEKAIRDSDGMTRSELMRKYRLTAREATEIEATLVGRGLVVITTVNRGTVYRAATRKV